MFHTDCIPPDLLIEGPQDLKNITAKGDVNTVPASEIPEIQGLIAALRATARPAVVGDSRARRYIPDLAEK
jgi:hypothetical protein